MRNKAETVFQEEEQKSKKCKIGEKIRKVKGWCNMSVTQVIGSQREQMKKKEGKKSSTKWPMKLPSETEGCEFLDRKDL